MTTTTELLAEHALIAATAVTPEELAALAHLRGHCHDSSSCPLCFRNERLMHQALTIDELRKSRTAPRPTFTVDQDCCLHQDSVQGDNGTWSCPDCGYVTRPRA